MVALHGFAESGELFLPLTELVEPEVTLYAPDLPWHGHTQWRRESYGLDDLRELLREIAGREGRPIEHLCGYSMGGRLAMSLFQKQPEAFSEIWLLAPDGVRTQWLSLFDLLPEKWFQRLAQWVEQRPEKVLSLIGNLHHVGLVDNRSWRFTQRFFTTREGRIQSLRSWVALRRFPHRKSAFIRQVRKQQTPVLIVAGEYDPVIPMRALQTFAGRMPTARFLALNAGHRLLRRELVDKLSGFPDGH